MLSRPQRNIIIRALRIRQQNGEDPEVAIKDYDRLSPKEKTEILQKIRLVGRT